MGIVNSRFHLAWVKCQKLYHQKLLGFSESTLGTKRIGLEVHQDTNLQSRMKNCKVGAKNQSWTGKTIDFSVQKCKQVIMKVRQII